METMGWVFFWVVLVVKVKGKMGILSDECFDKENYSCLGGQVIGGGEFSNFWMTFSNYS